ncbi:hypothetical protein SLA2020_201510 [Shorea laevis]
MSTVNLGLWVQTCFVSNQATRSRSIPIPTSSTFGPFKRFGLSVVVFLTKSSAVSSVPFISSVLTKEDTIKEEEQDPQNLPLISNPIWSKRQILSIKPWTLPFRFGNLRRSTRQCATCSWLREARETSALYSSV